MWVQHLHDTWRQIGLADIVDIAIVTSLLYALLLWFKRTKAAFVARGIVIFVLIYFVARQANMYLTTWIFQGFFAIFVVALVIIFQEELRSFFERVAVWSLRRGKGARPLQLREVEVLVQTLGQFAHERIGALIVLKGRDPLERHLDGGYVLDGELSGPLVASIFDSHSEGHDGAVIIDGNRIVRFAVQLPLSKEFHKLSGLGTRHTAAVGLSERTDALCLVVSEERGTISTARQGHLMVMRDLHELEQQLISFVRKIRITQTPVSWWTGFFKRHLLEKAIAVTLAIVLWLVFAQGFRPTSHTFQLPVETQNVPAHLRVEAIRPPQVVVSLAGLTREFGYVKPTALKVTLDLAGTEAGVTRVVLAEQHLRIPATLRLVAMEPDVVEVQLGPAKSDRGSLLNFLGVKGSEAPAPPAAP